MFLNIKNLINSIPNHKNLGRYTFARLRKRIVESSLFDSRYYLLNNPDVEESGMDPLQHYLKYGGFEGRMPSEDFDSAFYLEEYDDVKASGMNPLLHYILHGKEERRKAHGELSYMRNPVLEKCGNTGTVADLRNQARHFQASFLIIAETSIRQCLKYRVLQKMEFLQSSGFTCTVVDWHDTRKALRLLQAHKVVIFYRVPATRETLHILKEAELLGVKPFFEIDDLVFDEVRYRKNPNLQNLNPRQVDELLYGAGRYRRMLVACKNTIASTPVLAGLMQKAGGGESMVIENALDSETLYIAQNITKSGNDDRVRIFYGSGTKTHDKDFEVAGEALYLILQKYPHVDLVIAGELKLPEKYAGMDQQLIRIPALPFDAYLQKLGEADISVSPLAEAEFNDAKSNIKYLEAAVMGIPSVCSPAAPYREVIEHGENGCLAKTTKDWFDALEKLVVNHDIRKKTGHAARSHVMKEFSPEAVIRKQYSGFCKLHQPAEDGKLRVLVVNVFFHPNSYGGATILAEEMVRQLSARDEFRVAVFTSAFREEMGDREFVRWTYMGVPVFKTRITMEDLLPERYTNPAASVDFGMALRVFRPDVVHFHSIPGLGMGLASVCRQNEIPYIITLHDSWWLCERQNLLDGNGKFCGQESIDLNLCETCTERGEETRKRAVSLKKVLNDSAMVLTPGEHWRNFYTKNGIAGGKIRVNGNGIHIPQKISPNRAKSGMVRFGFVAGNEVSKGYLLIKEVFEQLKLSNWQLVMVDHSSHEPAFGKRSIEIDGIGKVTILPKYTPDNADLFWDKIDVLLFPIQVPESFGLTVREALIRNKWVISSRYGGLEDTIRDGENGNLIPLSSDPRHLYKAVEDLLHDPDKLTGWENPLKSNIRSFDDQAGELVEIYREVVSASKNQHSFDGG